MRNLIKVSFIIFISFAMAAEWVGLTSDTPAAPEKGVISSNIETTVLEFNIPGYWQDEIIVNGQAATVINIEDGTPLLQAAAPELLKLTASLIIPDNAQMQVDILDAEFIDFENVSIPPSKGNFTRDIDPATVPYVYGPVYQRDAFFPENIADLGSPYIVRDFRGQAVWAHPFQYNPITKTLRVYHHIELGVTVAGEGQVNVLDRREPLTAMVKEFNSIYEHHFDNWSMERYDILGEEGNMLIVCYDNFMDAMAPFVEWKNLKGIPTEIVALSEIGSNSGAINTFVSDYYENEGLAFLLLIGDNAQVPSMMVGGSASDPSYGYQDGNDSYPEFMVGRFSAENVSHVETQVLRSVEYERYPEAGADWYKYGFGIGSSQGSGIGDEGEADWQHLDIIRDWLMAYTYTDLDQIYDTNGGSSSDVTNALNEGRSVGNYCGHGSSNSWVSTGFSNTHVNNLENDNRLPFLWSVACVNGQFHQGTCFAEAWLRATNGDEPTGAIAALMSTVNQSWAPPMEAQDEFNLILSEAYGDENIKRTFGGLSANGCMSMNDDYGSSGEEETDYWTLFGDPSIVVRTDTPADMAVAHDAVIVIGTTEFIVSTGVEDALAALSLDGELVAFAYADAAGNATISFDEPITEPGEMYLVVTAYNHMPYETGIFAIVPEGPYVVLDEYIVSGDSNGNGEVDYGETIDLTICAENVGVDPALNVVGTVISDDMYVTIENSTVNFGDIEAGAIVLSVDTATIQISNTTPDGYTASLTVQFTSDTETWESGFSITVNAYCVTGDVNADWEINVLDVIRTVNIIIGIGPNPSELELCAADIDENGIINIIDVIFMINFIVDQYSRPGTSAVNAEYQIQGSNINIVSDGAVAGIQMTVRGSQIQVHPEYTGQAGIGTDPETGLTQVVLFSTAGSVVSAGSTALLTANDDIEVINVITADVDGTIIESSVVDIPNAFSLKQNHPNPFNPTTSIEFSIPSSEMVRLAVYDLLGREVAVLMNEFVSAGNYTAVWNGLDSNENLVPSGLYIYTLTAGSDVSSGKMVMMK